MKPIIETVWRSFIARVNRFLLSHKQAEAHRIKGIQARFIVARPGAGSLARLAAERPLHG